MASAIDAPNTTPLPPSPPLNPSDYSSSHRDLSLPVIINGQPTPRTSPDRSPQFSQDETGVKPSNSSASAVESGRGNETKALEKARKGRIARLEDFQLIHTLGKGCAGRVLLVKHTPTNQVHAMKAISKRSVLTHDELAHTLAEMSILKRFALDDPNNPFVARLHYSFTDVENFYLVMEFYPGGDMATQMERDGILGHHRTRFYAADIVAGLEDLHRHGIIVRDLKPENILLNAKGHAVLADFGLSKEFPYRGNPVPIPVEAYLDQPDLPEWAGMGMGSWRTEGGIGRLTVDRAYSFVGTSEYLSPEVIQRGEYTYAVDWWALGCIVLEGMTGRVPFRKADDEPPLVLWNKILMDPWDDMFYEPVMIDKPPEYFGLDPVTMHFIDSLLQKDPMWRLTEPFVKQHPFFSYIDWNTVRTGEYEDPHHLKIHPMIEYNTRYFPKLCLEEPPSVDMSTHTERYLDEDPSMRTPLNDNLIYKFEQAKYMKELADFSWTRPGWFGAEWEIDEEGEEILDDKVELVGYVGEESNEVVNQLPKTYLGPLYAQVDAAVDGSSSTNTEISESLQLETGEAAKRTPIKSPHTSPLSIDHDLPSPRSTRRTSLPVIPDTTTHPASPTTLHQHPISSDTLPSHPPDTLISAHPMPTNTKRQSYIANSPRTLPEGLPAGGLSVSDMISVASPGLGSPRIIRRHPRGPDDQFSVPIARLSVELNGTITQLEDEEWEKLDIQDIGEAEKYAVNQNQSGSSKFFSRGFSALRRRPSTIGLSSLRRQTGSDSARGSPTKGGGVIPPQGLFGGQSIESTKKAFGKIKSFPKSGKKDHAVPLITPFLPGMGSNPLPSRPPLPLSATTPNLSVKASSEDQVDHNQPLSSGISNTTKLSRSRSFFSRRSNPEEPASATQVEPSDKQVKKKKSMKKTKLESKSHSKSNTSNSSVSGSAIGSGSSGIAMSGSVSSMDPPRVELKETSPVVWEYGDGVL